MTLYAQEAWDHAYATLGIVESAGRSSLGVVNDAGRMLLNAHPWRFRIGRSQQIALTAGQDYAALPTGMEKVISIRTSDALVYYSTPVTLEEILELRTSTTSGPYDQFRYAVSYDHTAGAVPQPVLELFPSVTADNTTTLQVFGRFGWPELTSDNSLVEIPAWVEPIYLETVRVVASSYNALRPELSLTQMMQELKAGELFRDATRVDGGVLADLGLERKGAASRRALTERWDTIPMGAPSGPS